MKPSDKLTKKQLRILEQARQIANAHIPAGYWDNHQLCPRCSGAALQMVAGETRTCPVCGMTWTRES